MAFFYTHFGSFLDKVVNELMDDWTQNYSLVFTAVIM